METKKALGVLAGSVHCSVSIESLKWQLALKLVPDWSQVGSHVELMMQLMVVFSQTVFIAAVGQAGEGGGEQLQIRGFGPCYVLLIFEFYLRLLFLPYLIYCFK